MRGRDKGREGLSDGRGKQGTKGEDGIHTLKQMDS